MGKLIRKGKHMVKEGDHLHTNIISKPVNFERRRDKCRMFKMYLKVRYQQPKTIMYIQTAIPIPHNRKTKIYIDATQKKEYKHNTESSHQITREQKRKGERKRCIKQQNGRKNICMLPAQSCQTLYHPMDCSPLDSSAYGILQARNTEGGFHFLLQGIFTIQGSNLHLLCWQADSLPQSHLESPKRKYISIITLSVNRLSAPTKRHRMVKCIQKQNPHLCSLQEIHFRSTDTYRVKVKG